MLLRKMSDAKSFIEKANLHVYKFKDENILRTITEVEKAIVEIKNNFLLN
jgi:hypothetical protein